MQPPRTPKAARTAACWPRRAASAPTADAPPPPPPPWTSKVELFSSFSSVTPARVCCGGQQIRGARPRIQWRRTRGCCVAVVWSAGSGRSRPGSAGNGAGGMGNGRRGGGGAGRGTGFWSDSIVCGTGTQFSPSLFPRVPTKFQNSNFPGGLQRWVLKFGLALNLLAHGYHLCSKNIYGLIMC
jgi:hypothetical protein